MISISHWGMFEVRATLLTLPEGWKIADWDRFIAEIGRPDGIIEIVRA